MEKSANEIEKLVAQSKKLKESSCIKKGLEEQLSELTLCNNMAILSKKRNIFNSKVLNVSCKVICNAVAMSQCTQMLIVVVKNVSEKFTFSNQHWQFCVTLNNDRSQSVWNLEHPLKPGQSDKFCCPLSENNFDFLLQLVQVRLKFTLPFKSETYVRMFIIQECIIDILHCLDPARVIVENGISRGIQRIFSNLTFDESNTKPFPPITKFLLRLGHPLREIFIKDILLRDSWHRGFETMNGLCNETDVCVFYVGIKIDIRLSPNSDFIVVNCSNPYVLSAVKASILRRFALVSGILVEGLNDESREKLHYVSTKLNAFESDDYKLQVAELMEFYLDLRDISESICYTLINVIE